MKRCLTLLLVLFFAYPLAAQSQREALLEFQARRRQAYVEFQDNYRKACADFMRKRWEAFRSEAPVPIPARKEPEHPVVKQPDNSTVSAPEQMPYVDVPIAPATPAKPEISTTPATPTIPKVPDTPKIPDVPKVTDVNKDDAHTPPVGGKKDNVTPNVDASRSCRFTFYGTNCSVSLTSKHKFRLVSLQENSVASAWARVADGSYDTVVGECRDLKKQLQLNDWGYYDLVRTLSDAFCGKQSSESVVLQSFLMAEAGYKVRLSRGDNRLVLLLALDEQVYGKPYFTIEGQVFFLLDDVVRAASYNICNFNIPGERSLSLAMPTPPLFTQKNNKPAMRNTPDGCVSTTVTVNQNLMDFYTNYPACYWSIYPATGLTPSVSDELYPALQKTLAGKNEYETANLLLHYLHQAFPYKTDEAQFGVERTLFAEEMFHYPYSDCEDRSILFARLVKDLMRLEVVLLYYPQHIATAVCFKGDVKGDYIQIGSKRYVVCDPTYIGANVGDAMPDLKGVKAQVVKIN